MPKTNLTHRTTNGLPKIYTVFFSNIVAYELERISSLNFCNMTIRPYRRWLKYFYATVEWIGEIDKWLSMLSYGYISGSIRHPNHTFTHTCRLGSVTYHFVRQDNGDIGVMCDHLSLNPFTYNRTTILMETSHRKIVLKEFQLRNLIRECIDKVLNIA